MKQTDALSGVSGSTVLITVSMMTMTIIVNITFNIIIIIIIIIIVIIIIIFIIIVVSQTIRILAMSHRTCESAARTVSYTQIVEIARAPGQSWSRRPCRLIFLTRPGNKNNDHKPRSLP